VICLFLVARFGVPAIINVLVELMVRLSSVTDDL